MSHPTDLSGKVALVTGGSRGIGAGIAKELASHGARTIVNYVADPQGRNLADAQTVSSEIGATLIQCDVGDDNQVAAMMAQVRQEFGGLDILVNNAGIIRDRTLVKMSHEEWDSVIRVNLTGTFNCLHHAVPILRPDGRVVNLSSVTGIMGLFGQANYAASKAGIIALTRTAARELARNRITVNAIAPGFIDTAMTADLPPETLRAVPARRAGTPDEVAACASFLASERAAYVTGTTLFVDGGLSA